MLSTKRSNITVTIIKKDKLIDQDRVERYVSDYKRKGYVLLGKPVRTKKTITLIFKEKLSA